MDSTPTATFTNHEARRPKLVRKYSLFARVSQRVSGYVLAFWLSLINRFGRAPICGPTGPIVSMTTYGDRIRVVHLAIESIGRGQLRPSRTILWLDEVEAIRNLPAALQRLEKRGLEVKLCKNYGPHKKYFPLVQSETSISAPLATADDDVLYPAYWLKELANALQAFPDCVNCFRAREIALRDGTAVPYQEWVECSVTTPSFRHFSTGVSGAIYSPDLLIFLKSAGTGFHVCCPRADDIWLHVQALRAGYRVRQVRSRARHFPLIPGTQKISLHQDNVVNEDGNDVQVRATYTIADYAILLRENSLGSSPASEARDAESSPADSLV